jgi:hypothetical protein
MPTLNKCDNCDHKPDANGGFCYMFRTEPVGEWCGQNTLTQDVIRNSPILKSIVTALGPL